tara:strand:- start:933 stop:1697 length:765 start_codon:yes stop_codon:yes gene_type:complete
MKEKYLEELKKEGIVVIPNYFNKNKCKKVIDQIELFSKTKKVFIERDEGIGGDIRVFKFEEYSDEALNFSKDDFIKKIVSKYCDQKLETKSVLAGKVLFEKKYQTNSGGDWHRDADVKQMKAMLYLSDVKDENGPFCFIKESKNFDFKRRDNKYAFLQKIIFKIKGLPLKPPRYENEYIMKQPKTRDKILRVKGNSGTLVIFDGSYIHRGDVIRSGTRYSLTNYYYPVLKKGFIFFIKSFFKRILNPNQKFIRE